MLKAYCDRLHRKTENYPPDEARTRLKSKDKFSTILPMPRCFICDEETGLWLCGQPICIKCDEALDERIRRKGLKSDPVPYDQKQAIPPSLKWD
jgi:hypothetical protein